jgi:hypothetical protein
MCVATLVAGTVGSAPAAARPPYAIVMPTQAAKTAARWERCRLRPVRFACADDGVETSTDRWG